MPRRTNTREIGSVGLSLRVRQQAFTLLELLISIAIGSILLSVAVPSYTTFVQNSRQVSTANELLGSLHVARDLAITRNVRITVCPSSTGSACEAVAWSEGWIVFADPDDSRTLGGGETVERSVTELPGVSITTSDFGSYVVYRPNGRAMVDTVAENSGELTICDDRGGEHARVVAIDFSGRPRISEHTLAGATPTCPG